MALDEYAKKTEAAARAARDEVGGLSTGANPFLRQRTIDKAAAAEMDAAKARAAADKAHNDSLWEQQRISEEIAHQQRVHAKELEALWAQMNKRVADAEQTARDQAAAARDAEQATAAAAEAKKRKEDEAAQEEKRRALEKQKDDLERQIAARGGAAISDPGTARDGADRSRRINGRARPARAGFGVDDVRRYQQSSLRGEMDAAIGPVGNRRPTSGTDKQAHQMKVQQANQGGDPLLAQLAGVRKELEQINRNTEGLQKSKSEALVRQ